MKQQPEYILQCQVAQYLRIQYPNVLFLSDTVASIKLTIPQQLRNKKIQKDGFRCPDLLILEPLGGYSGLFIELKSKKIYKKNGELLKNEHVEAQNRTIKELLKKGYYACFAVGFNESKQIIDNYMKIKIK